MNLVRILVLGLILTGCAPINSPDLSREEVAQAFKERDSVLTGIATMLKDHKERIDSLESKK